MDFNLDDLVVRVYVCFVLEFVCFIYFGFLGFGRVVDKIGVKNN